mmetsp:Transcript_49385/g.114152  ORF Transcript_49385/g.114152 Transcript_49385/m.114152 type:complete len:209 (-) Transcript_49385:129-755(-)|eukprot:CAMPEP_0119356316 /NCGR_PEP_ID=MMETSP1334-20130426/4956_1 /TAXON_ID=127549 /ORGANISM="Calcidiscus leptoporus, Strain RCC1130" /LENGTH=208 /DNA_ID=CAMNT_0007370331 /DNA_START=166 /DNA_END=792 /DNA_ORIENTATION=+
MDKLPNIQLTVPTLQSTTPQTRSDVEQAEIDRMMDDIHEQLGVRRGHALEEALKPKLECPMPVVAAVAEPRLPVPLLTTGTTAAAAAPTAMELAEAAGLPVPSSEPPAAVLALPAPEDINSLITLDVNSGQAVTLDQLGPVVVNTDGSLARITNWHQMSEQEQAVTKRRIAKRNVSRLKVFAERGDLKESLMGALQLAEPASSAMGTT